MLKSEIDEIEKKAKAATQGKWITHDYGVVSNFEVTSDISTICTVNSCNNGQPLPQFTKLNAEYIASVSPDVTLKLIAYVRKLEAVRDAAIKYNSRGSLHKEYCAESTFNPIVCGCGYSSLAMALKACRGEGEE